MYHELRKRGTRSLRFACAWDSRRSEASLRHAIGSGRRGRSIKSVIAVVVACLAAGACADRAMRPAYVGQSPYQGWSCDQLSREVARTDGGVGEGQKNAIEQTMIEKNCIHPLAAETE